MYIKAYSRQVLGRPAKDLMVTYNRGGPSDFSCPRWLNAVVISYRITQSPPTSPSEISIMSLKPTLLLRSIAASPSQRWCFCLVIPLSVGVVVLTIYTRGPPEAAHCKLWKILHPSFFFSLHFTHFVFLLPIHFIINKSFPILETLWLWHRKKLNTNKVKMQTVEKNFVSYLSIIIYRNIW